MATLEPAGWRETSPAVESIPSRWSVLSRIGLSRNSVRSKTESNCTTHSSNVLADCSVALVASSHDSSHRPRLDSWQRRTLCARRCHRGWEDSTRCARMRSGALPSAAGACPQLTSLGDRLHSTQPRDLRQSSTGGPPMHMYMSGNSRAGMASVFTGLKTLRYNPSVAIGSSGLASPGCGISRLWAWSWHTTPAVMHAADAVGAEMGLRIRCCMCGRCGVTQALLV